VTRSKALFAFQEELNRGIDRKLLDIGKVPRRRSPKPPGQPRTASKNRAAIMQLVFRRNKAGIEAGSKRAVATTPDSVSLQELDELRRITLLV